MRCSESARPRPRSEPEDGARLGTDIIAEGVPALNPHTGDNHDAAKTDSRTIAWEEAAAAGSERRNLP